MPHSKHSAQPPSPLTDDQSSWRIDCYMRDRVPAPLTATIESIPERLQELREAGVITEYSVSPWPPSFSSDGSTDADNHQTRADVISEFETWATEYGYTLKPAFRRQTSHSPFAPQDTRKRLSVPIVVLALYQDETLCGVIPSTKTDSDVTYTVMDCLDALEQEEYEALPLPSATTTIAPSDTVEST